MKITRICHSNYNGFCYNEDNPKLWKEVFVYEK